MTTTHGSPHRSETGNRLSELTLLYQFSNTLLSTIRLNKLTHLILTAITTPSSNLFERAVLFLRNEKSDVLQGMLGVTSDLAEELQIVGGNEPLECRWDISDNVMAHQKSAEFCLQVRLTRIEIDGICPLINRLIQDRSQCRPDEVICNNCKACQFLRLLSGYSFAAVPLIARDTVIGIIVVDNPVTNREITSSSLHFLQLFANQAGMAIENSILYTRIEDAHLNLKDARERLLHGERLAAIGEMAANLAHELKNPLITIGGFAGRLLKQLPGETKEHHYADTIVSEISRLEKMLAEILAFSRKPTICFHQCDLGAIVHDSLSSCTASLEDHGIAITLNGCDSPWPISGDCHQLKQVFLNLMLNSCDAMPNGGRLAIDISFAHHATKPYVAVSVTDTGSGIPPEMLSQIFSPFFTTKHHGTGLGLAIVNRIVLNHFGTIEACNTGSGARFIVTLPLADISTEL